MAEQHPVLFETDGFRALATDESGPGLMNEETFAGLTKALVDYQTDNGERGMLVVAQDTRPSGEVLVEAAVAAGHESGVAVWNLGVAPTPMAQQVARKFGARATVVATASHNPVRDNGFKGMLGESKPNGEQSKEISDRYWQQVDSGLVIPIHRGAAAHEKTELTEWYTDQVVDSIEQEFGERPLEGKLLVVDGAYGAGQKVTPAVLEKLGATVERFACDGGGVINDGVGAASLGGLEKFLAQHPEITDDPQFMGAVANDGDADRMMGMGVIKENGERRFVTLDGNHVMGALAQGEPGIIGTEYTNSGLVTALRGQGVDFEYCPNGDSHVTAALLAKQAAGEKWRRGGEFTGHHVDLDWLSSGDGVRMAAWYAAHAAREGKTFGDLHREMSLWPEVMQKVEFSNASHRRGIKEDPAVIEAIAQAQEDLGDKGRIVLRPSGTEPLVRIWGEGLNGEQIRGTVARLAGVVATRAAA